MTKRRPHRHQREQSTRQFGGKPDSARSTTTEGRPAEIAETTDDLPAGTDQVRSVSTTPEDADTSRGEDETSDSP